MKETKRTPAKRKKPACRECGRPTTGGAYCSSECELKILRKQVAEQSERLARVNRKKDPVQCYGRVHWETCVQEWYTKSSYDAKRRTAELRALGYECSAQCIGKMPVMKSDGMVGVLMTIVTCHLLKPDGCGYTAMKLPPDPAYAEGIGVPWGRLPKDEGGACVSRPST